MPLPGLQPVRNALSLTQRKLAEDAGIGLTSVQSYEKDTADCSAKTLKSLCLAMTCGTDDLFGIPSPFRLAQIRANWYRKQAALADAEATNLAKKISQTA